MREVEENGFPAPEKIGTTLYFNTALVNLWLSEKANRTVTLKDRFFHLNK